jgi:hypothetical protein
MGGEGNGQKERESNRTGALKYMVLTLIQKLRRQVILIANLGYAGVQLGFYLRIADQRLQRRTCDNSRTRASAATKIG